MKDFTEAKRDELYRVLEMIDNAGLEPFRVWSGRRGYEFGEWADRLGIYDYMRRAESFQYKVLEINSITRKQIEANFEGVGNIDVRGADALREYAETVKGQIRAARIMMQFIQSAGKTGINLETLLHSLTLQSKVSYEEQLEEGQKVLQSYLRVRGITDPAEQQEICSLILKKQPYLLANLYTADYYNSMDTGVIYNSIMDCYDKYRHAKELACAEGLFDRYLISCGYTNSVEREFVIDMICEAQPDSLLNWYHADIYSMSDCEEITESIKKYYINNKNSIELETIEERFRNDERAGQYSVVCEYLEYLVDLQYICQAECDQYVSSMGEGIDINSDRKDELCGFMRERKELIKAFEGNKVMSNNVKDGGWDRGQIMCALQIEAELTAIGYDKEFIIGLIGNMKAEGNFGKLEGTNLTGYPYWEHINNCIGYHDLYSNKWITNIDLIKFYVDMICKRNEEECENVKLHYFGMGAIQWTNTRAEALLELYFKEAGYDTESDEFQGIIQCCQKGEAYEKVYLTEEQVRTAEMEMMIHELTENDAYKKVYSSYQSECGNDTLNNVKLATKKIKNGYIHNQGDSLSKREAAALRWYEEQYSNCTE